MVLMLGFWGCKNNSDLVYTSSTNIIPAPKELNYLDNYISLERKINFKSIEYFSDENRYFYNYLHRKLGIEFDTPTNKNDAQILFTKNNNLNEEEYILTIDKNITLEANTRKGLFYGIQTLIQLLPFEHLDSLNIQEIEIPRLKIKDNPQFAYRGMHLDISRHFFDKEFIKKYIKNLAMLKMNTFHWHLTDDQGWRIEIKKYPKLTTHAAFRDSTLIGHYNDTPIKYDTNRYGGFYTQEDVKEIVAFAQKHHVTIIPEIELPGHAQAAVSAYPELGCTGEQVPVACSWGVFENIYCPKPETFTFLKNVLDEVMPLFPSEYIHIGGDEAPKKQWKACSHCQQLISEKNLKDEHGLQSYFIREIEKHVNNKGKKIIGWDEILEGGLAPNATVMSWRGTQGAVKAANEGHDVILTPTSHAYFDYYQATYEDEPIAIGGYLPLKKVYSFNPIPKKLQGTEAAKHVLGAQGNIWTEYITTEEHVEYMAFPRILAMAEVVWSGPTDNLEKDYLKFLERVEPFMERLDNLGINYANHLYDLEGAVVKNKGEVLYKLTTPTSGKNIKYSINDGEEEYYTQSINISALTSQKVIEGANQYIINGQVYKNEQPVGRKFTDTITYHKGINATVSLNVNPHPSYSAGGTAALINGVQGSNTRFGDKEWLGFWGDDLTIIITFPEPTEISKITTRFYNANGQWVYAPDNIWMIAFGENERLESSREIIFDKEDILINAEIEFESFIANKITINVPSKGIIPDGLQGAGNKAWTFIDEIVIE